MAISAISWIAQRLKEQSAIKHARDEMARRRNEELRTGRTEAPSPTSGASAPDAQAMQDLAARRQAQLRELRARQAQQQSQSGRTMPPVVIAPVPPPVQTQHRPTPMPQGTLRPTPLPGGQRPVPVQRPTPRPQQRRQESIPPGVVQQIQRVQAIAASRPIARAPEAPPEVSAARAPSGDRLLQLIHNRTTGKPDAARLIVLGEILGIPPSMRD